MTLGRRDFLLRLSAALAAYGCTDTVLAGYSTAYQHALADANRCLAVLVGINVYSANTWKTPPAVEKGSFLEGALTDVELQRELLIGRFGVLPQDIVTLANDEATVSQILETIQGHLVDQARPGDTVVFHFSGLGSQVRLSDQPQEVYLPTLVASDSQLPEAEAPVIQDLFEESLGQLLGDLRGVKVLTVIDASTAAHPKVRRGNFRVRSRPTTPVGLWQAPFDPRFKAPSQPWQKLAASWPGVLLQAQSAGELALEGTWEDFSAGLFTYALTQQIWTSLPAQRQQWFIHNIDRKLASWTGSKQSSEAFSKQLRGLSGLPLLSGRLPKPAADGVVKTVDTVNRSAIVWLGGLPAALLPYCELGLKLRPLPSLPGLTASPEGQLTIRTLTGLRAKATLEKPQGLPVGAPLIEVERRFPKELTLTIALDPVLDRIERVDATSALSNMPFIVTTAPGEKTADCLFGKGTRTFRSDEAAAEATQNDADSASKSGDRAANSFGYGLFNPDGSPIPSTTTAGGEAVKTAVSRLQGTLRSLLAAKMLQLTVNPISSQLPVRLILETQEPKNRIVRLEETSRSRQLSNTTLTPSERLTFKPLPRDRPEQYQLRMLNAGSDPLYYLLIRLVEKNQVSVYCPPTDLSSEGGEQSSSDIANESQLPSQQAITYPQMPDSTFTLQPLRTTEVFAIAAIQPFTKTWQAIRASDFRYQGDRWATVADPLAMTRALFQDLNQASTQPDNTPSDLSEGVQAFRAHAWSTLSL